MLVTPDLDGLPAIQHLPRFLHLHLSPVSRIFGEQPLLPAALTTRTHKIRSQMIPDIVQNHSWRYKTTAVIKRDQNTI